MTEGFEFVQIEQAPTVAELAASMVLAVPTPDPANPKDVAGAKKPDVSLIPSSALLHEAKAMQNGADKYGPFNWRDRPIKMKSYLAAAMRHIQQLMDGEDFDPESGAHHAAHGRATLGIVLDAMENGTLIDDRPARGVAGEMIRHFNATGTFEGRLTPAH